MVGTRFEVWEAGFDKNGLGSRANGAACWFNPHLRFAFGLCRFQSDGGRCDDAAKHDP
jgi:hypothetical protein